MKGKGFKILLTFILGTTLTSCDLVKDFLSNITSSSESTSQKISSSSSSSSGNSSQTISSSSSSSSTSISENGVTEGIIFPDFQIHFMMLGNDKAGDSIYIKAGETDIIIDAGSRQGSTKTTKEYMNQYIKDNKLEYVILTHGDQDHVEGFTDSSSNKGILSSYAVDTIIDNQYTTKTTQVYNKYITLRDSLVSKGTKHYYASQCYNNESGAQRVYQLSENVKMSILYNYYYFNVGTDENNYSVCTLFTYTTPEKEYNFMFTGDLELEGEEKMAEYYSGSDEEHTLPEVDLFKAGHHGSKTSTNECLLKIIKPKMCVVSCCCGTNEYTGIVDNQFPTQAFISRIAKYTDKVYVTSIYQTYEILTAKDKGNGKSDTTGIAIGGNYISTSGYQGMNGNVVVSCSSNGVGLYCSKSYTKLKDSEWLNTKIVIDGKERQMRIWG